jgi:hypothetical protein
MVAMTRRAPLLRAAFAALTLTLALAPSGCEDEKKRTQPADVPDSGATPRLLDGKLGEAAAAAEASATARNAPSKGGATEDGPPEKGVFEPAAAEKALPRGAPPKVEILGEGSEPRAVMSAKVEAGATRKAVLTLGLRAQMPVDIDFATTFKIEKPKDAKDAKDKKAGADAPKKAEEGGAPAGLQVVAKIESVGVSAQKGSPEELAKIFGKLKGSQLRYSAMPDGSARDFSYEIAKDADPNLESAFGMLVEALSMMVAPLPSKPVGAGAYWMVTDRASSSGVEVIRYRVFRVTKMDGGQPTLSMELRQYAADGVMRVPGGPKDATMSIDRFE